MHGYFGLGSDPWILLPCSPGGFDYFLGPALYFALDYWRLAQGASYLVEVRLVSFLKKKIIIPIITIIASHPPMVESR
jgi:hypothetical protein